MVSSKNNPDKRVKQEGKSYNGKVVKPVLYIGKHAGHGKYIAIQFSDTGDMVLDKNNKPVMWDSI